MEKAVLCDAGYVREIQRVEACHVFKCSEDSGISYQNAIEDSLKSIMAQSSGSGWLMHAVYVAYMCPRCVCLWSVSLCLVL